MKEVCYWVFCFVPASTSTGPSIFGFAEFIAALALLVVIYTVVDIRYKFRLAITPGSLYPTTFGLIAFIGGGTLLTELWLAEGWWVPKVTFVTRAMWQAIFGALFLGTFLTWMYYAFIRPPVFSKRNARRFAQNLYRLVLKGSNSELPVIADELSRSAAALVKFSRRLSSTDGRRDVAKDKQEKPGVEDYAHDLLLLIGNRKLCRHIVESSPGTALVFFQVMADERKFDIPIGQFSKNISIEAIANKDSILYHETDGYTSGLIGYLKPWTQTIYGNFDLIEALAERFGSPLDVDYRTRWSWDGQQWDAYCRATLAALKGYLTSHKANALSSAISQALNDLEDAFRDVYKLNESRDDLITSEISERLRVAVRFVRSTIELLDEQKTRPVTTPRRRGEDGDNDIYDQLAALMFKIVFAASSVSGPEDLSWSIQYNAVWGEFFDLGKNTRSWHIVHFKLRRLLYDEVIRLSRFPNYKGARILGLLLNVMGLKASTREKGYEREYWPLAAAVHAWTRRSYLKLREDNCEVADACLIGGISFDEQGKRLMKTYFKGLNKEAPREYLELDPLHSVGPNI